MPRSPPDPAQPDHRPKRLFPLLLLPPTSPRITQASFIRPYLGLVFDPHKDGYLQHIVVLLQPLSRIQKARYNLHSHARPVPSLVPHLARLDLRRSVRDQRPPFRRREGRKCIIPDIRVRADLEVWTQDRHPVLHFARCGAGRGEGDFDGVEKRVAEVEEEVGGDAGLQCVVVDRCRGSVGGGRGVVGVDGADGEARDVVEGQQLDLVARGCDLGLGLCEDLAAGAAAFGALGAEEGGKGTQLVCETYVRVDLGVLLGGGKRDAPALFFDAFNGLSIDGGVMETEALELGGSLAHRGRFRALFLLGAGGRVALHDAGIGGGRGEVDVVGGEGRLGGVRVDLGLVEGLQVREEVVVGGRCIVVVGIVCGGGVGRGREQFPSVTPPRLRVLPALTLLVPLLRGGQRLPPVLYASQLGADALAAVELDANLDAAPLAVLALEDEGRAAITGGVQRVRVHGRSALRAAEAAPVAAVAIALDHGAGHLEET